MEEGSRVPDFYQQCLRFEQQAAWYAMLVKIR